jgi:hypothetical protein
MHPAALRTGGQSVSPIGCFDPASYGSMREDLVAKRHERSTMPAVLTQVQPTLPTTRQAQTSRIDALDWTKGALVLCMVAYHAINYSAFRPMAFRFLPFLPPSFVLIAGFLVGQVYASKYDLTSWKPYLRLFVRGVKLLVLFTVLNAAYLVFLERSLYFGLGEFADRAAAIFLTGTGRVGIFEVLLPIAYFLLLSPGLLWLRSKSKWSVAAVAAGVFILCTVLEKSGLKLDNLGLLSAGLIGMALGLVSIHTIHRFARQWIPVVLLYLAHHLCGYFWGEIYPVQLFGAVTTLLLLYCIALHMNSAGWWGRQMVRLGQYSLLAYLAQIALLQMVVRVSGKPDRWFDVIGTGLITAFLLFLMVPATDKLRERFRSVDLLYRGIFA